MEQYFSEDGKKGTGFYLMLAALALYMLMAVGIDFDEYLQHQDLRIPTNFFWLLFLTDALMISGLILILFYRKAGVFLYPFALIAHFLLHIYYLSTFLYTDVTNLFLFVGIGLLVLIPKWPYLK